MFGVAPQLHEEALFEIEDEVEDEKENEDFEDVGFGAVIFLSNVN